MAAAPPGAPPGASGKLRVRIGHDTMDAASPVLDAAIARANADAAIPGLPDTLNPGIIDPAKLHALLRNLAPAAITALGGKALLLSPTLLRIGAAAPTTAASFAGSWTLEPRGTHGEAVSARATVPVDCALARRRAAEAQAAFTQADTAVRKAEAARPADHAGLVALSGMRTGRHATATVWKDAAAAALSCTPDDPAIRDSLAAATAAATAATVAPQVRGMP